MLTGSPEAGDAEPPPVTRSEFVYRIHIRSTQERLWEALYRPEHTRRYWGVEFLSDWAIGSSITWSYLGVTIEDPESIVVAFEPPNRLSYTWHVTTAELARAQGMSEEMRRRLDSEPRSTAEFKLEPSKDMIKLTLTQSGFENGSAKLASLSESWPRIMSQLKTYLEYESERGGAR
jgi:uncharacterized protein YndB with AHSA1/START domain